MPERQIDHAELARMIGEIQGELRAFNDNFRIIHDLMDKKFKKHDEKFDELKEKIIEIEKGRAFDKGVKWVLGSLIGVLGIERIFDLMRGI